MLFKIDGEIMPYSISQLIAAIRRIIDIKTWDMS